MHYTLVPGGTRPAPVAKEITRLHVEATNAPPSFVHVIILDAPPGVHYTAGNPTPTPPSSTCTIRAGHFLAVRQNLMKPSRSRGPASLDNQRNSLVTTITEVDASTAMEAGLILPQPGEARPHGSNTTGPNSPRWRQMASPPSDLCPAPKRIRPKTRSSESDGRPAGRILRQDDAFRLPELTHGPC